jgi:hypothetical protein
MSASSAAPPVCLGFLTVVENPECGISGGYLLLNPAGRPLEFHCTAPLKPTRAQEILYGRTLKPYLYGEQIGQTLIKKSRLAPAAICTDTEPVLAARQFVDLPIVWVQLPHAGSSGWTLSNCVARVAFPYEADEEQVRTVWPPQADQLDLLEPFTRIREALQEAYESAKQAA